MTTPNPTQGATADKWSNDGRFVHNPDGQHICQCCEREQAEQIAREHNAHASLAALAAAVVRQGHVIDGDTLRMAKSALAAARGVK